MIDQESSHVNEKIKLLKKYDIPVENLSYEYIRNCKDIKILENIVKILRSGEEGHFPDLIKFAENRLKDVCPINRLLIKPEQVLTPSSLNADDRNRISNEMESWSDEMKIKDDHLRGTVELKSPTFPPIRNSAESSITKKTPNVKKKCSIKSLDYDAWDKYDPDKEILKMEIEEEQEREEYARKSKEKHINNPLDANTVYSDNYSETEKQIFAEQEKDRGNEYFKAGEYEHATQFYTKSITILPNVAAYNNRAIANLKLKNYGEVITDCNEVLKLEPQNVKALFRRGNAHQCKGQLNEAMKDFIRVLEVDPTNNPAKSHVSELKKKLEETTEGKPKKARMVVEDMKSFEEELKSIQIFDKRMQSSSGSRPIPSWKNNYSSDPMSCGDNKLNEWGYSRVMCNCNSIPRALQKKCIPLSKRVDAETGKSSIQVANKYSYHGSKTQTRDEDLEKRSHHIEEKNNDFRMLCCSSGDNSNNVKAPLKDMPLLCDRDAVPSNRGVGVIFPDNKVTLSSSTDPSRNCEEKPMEISEDDGVYQDLELESPTSPYEFLKSWNQISEDEGFFKHANLLKRIGPSNLSTVIGNELDGEMLSTLLNCLNVHFNDEEELFDYLVCISHLPRFKSVQGFLSPQENEVVRGLFYKLEHSGKCQIKEDLKAAYGL